MAVENSKICTRCNKESMISGALLGVVFEPSTEWKKWFSTGTSHIQAYVCSECGYFSEIFLIPEDLQKVLKKKKK